MDNNVSTLSESELTEMIASAERALRERQEGRKQAVVAEIKALATSIGVTVEFSDAAMASRRRGSKVAVKYRDSREPSNQWTGRGMKPRWLREYVNAGRALEEFAV